MWLGMGPMDLAAHIVTAIVSVALAYLPQLYSRARILTLEKKVAECERHRGENDQLLAVELDSDPGHYAAAIQVMQMGFKALNEKLSGRHFLLAVKKNKEDKAAKKDAKGA